MKKIILAAILFASTAVYSQANWQLDNSHSSINFGVTHMGISTTTGSFTDFSGSFTASKEDMSDANIEFSINTKSITTGFEGRDEHLNADDFFHTEKFDKITFTSASFSKGKDGAYTLNGKMTMKDVTKEVTFKVMMGGVIQDPYGNTRAGFTATTIIDRTDFGVSGAQGGVGNEVNITVNVEFIKEKSK